MIAFKKGCDKTREAIAQRKGHKLMAGRRAKQPGCWNFLHEANCLSQFKCRVSRIAQQKTQKHRDFIKDMIK
jgi:hypothetical protein